MSDERLENLTPEELTQRTAIETLRDPILWERTLQAVGAEEAQRDEDVQELRALCRRMATRIEDMERRLRRLETEG